MKFVAVNPEVISTEMNLGDLNRISKALNAAAAVDGADERDVSLAKTFDTAVDRLNELAAHEQGG